MIYQRVTPEEYLTSAVVYNRQRDQVVGSITADKIPLEIYPSKHYEFYCSDCLDQKHAMRLVWLPQESRDAPARFRHYEYADATHVCDHPVRYQKLDELAVRYNAEEVGNHQYIFDVNLEIDTVIERVDRVVDQGSRVAKVTEALLYDRGLSEGQRLRLGSFERDFHDAVYDTSPADKLRLLRDSKAAGKAQRAFYAAMIFRPIGNRGFWKEYKKYNVIPGIAGKKDDFAGVQLQPSALLKCSTLEIYEKVREIADRRGSRKSAPIVVHGEARLNLITTYERAQAVLRGEKKVKAIYTTFLIKDVEQVSPWEERFDTFEAAAKHQASVQKTARKEKLGLFKPQMGLAL